jgi:putative endonuclease
MSTRGSEAEALAATYLERHGLAVIERNFRVRGGAVDLICRDGKVLVFVEVRLRSSTRFGGAAASVTSAKQRRVILAAQCYLAGKPYPSCRFDCVLLDALDPSRIEWLKNAFTAD